MTDFPFTPEEFHSIYSKVPRLTVEIVIKNSKGIYLTLRNIEPCKGQWHLPGGTVFIGESLQEAVKRIARRELGIEVNQSKSIGFIEYPSHFRTKIDHPFGVVFEVTDYDGDLKPNNEAQGGDWFSKMPENMHADQDVFMTSHNLF